MTNFYYSTPHRARGLFL